MKSVSTAVRGGIALAVAVLFAACENPVSSGTHLRPAAMEVIDEGTVVWAGQGTHVQDPTSTGAVTVAAGQQRTVNLRFTDRVGAAMTLTQGYYLDVAVTGDAGVATWQMGNDGASGTVAGLAPGTTELRVRWMHGPVGGGHEETRWNVPVVVTP